MALNVRRTTGGRGAARRAGGDPTGDRVGPRGQARRPHARGRARHRQDAAAPRRRRASVAARASRHRRDGRRGDPRPVHARPLDPRFGGGDRGGGGHATRPTRSAAASTRCRAGRPGPDEPAARPPAAPAFDLAAVAFRALADVRPLALLLDDLQWADDDSLRLLRYVIRADAESPLFLLFAIRPEELAFVTEAVNLLADMDRMGLVRRMKVGRFTQVDTARAARAAARRTRRPRRRRRMHAQAEGVPFIVEEMAHGVPRRRDGPAGRRRVDAREERRAPGAVRRCGR